MTIRCATVLSLLLSGMWLFAAPAAANGDMFFEAAEIPGNPEFVIFGSVKDDRGQYIVSAIVTVKVPEPRLSYTAETDILGRFRTLDIGRAVRGLGYDVEPERFEIIIEYPGHRVARRVNRGKRGQNKGAVEINFVITKEDE